MEKVPGIVVYTPPRDVKDWECFYIGIHKDYKIKPLCVMAVYYVLPDRHLYEASIVDFPKRPFGYSSDMYPREHYSTKIEDWGSHQEEVFKYHNKGKSLIFDDTESYLWEMHMSYNGDVNVYKLKNLVSVPFDACGNTPKGCSNLPIWECLRWVYDGCHIKKEEEYIMDDVVNMTISWNSRLIASTVICECLDMCNAVYEYQEKKSFFWKSKPQSIKFEIYGMTGKSGIFILDKLTKEIKLRVPPMDWEEEESVDTHIKGKLICI